MHLEQKYILTGSQKRKVLIRTLRLTLVCIIWSHFGHLKVEFIGIDRVLGKYTFIINKLFYHQILF
jgi:hypothetical protein